MNHIGESNIGNPHSERSVTVDGVLLEISVHLVCLWIPESVRGIYFGIDSQEAGSVWGLNEHSVEPLLSLVVEHVGEDPLLQPKLVVGLLPHHLVDKFGEPEDTILVVLVLDMED